MAVILGFSLIAYFLGIIFKSLLYIDYCKIYPHQALFLFLLSCSFYADVSLSDSVCTTVRSAKVIVKDIR